METQVNSQEKSHITSEDYVIVRYNKKSYPVTKTIQPKNEFVVSTMEKSGPIDWKWSEVNDEITLQTRGWGLSN